MPSSSLDVTVSVFRGRVINGIYRTITSNTFSPVPTKDSFTGDGSTTTFDLGTAVVNGGENALEVFVNNVRQEPGSGKAFTLGLDGSNELKRITFSAAPANVSIYVINDKTSSTYQS